MRLQAGVRLRPPSSPIALRGLFAAALLVLPAVAATGAETAAEPDAGGVWAPWVAGAEVRVVDVAEAADFYRGLLGFETTDDSALPEVATLHNGDVELTLRRVRTPLRLAGTAEAETHVNLMIEDLDQTLAALADAGVEPVGEVLTSAIGPYAVIRDPSGNLLHLMDVEHGDEEPLAQPRVFNLGLKVTDMKAAREFYIDKLGLEVFSEDYYPPVVPLQRSGVVALVLHESATEGSPVDYPDGAHTEVVFLTPDLAAALAELAARGLEPIDQSPAEAQPAAFATLRDPDGNLIQIRQGAAAMPR